MSETAPDRELTSEEHNLIQWMLEHGKPDAREFLPQLERARVLPNRCPCGCASIDFSVDGQPKPSGGLRPIADFVFGSGDELSGIFVFEQSGVLAGLEVYGLAGDAPRTLPSPELLRPFRDEMAIGYDRFFPDIPYWLSAGAWLDMDGFRYASDGVVTFRRLPFRLLSSRLAADLRSTWEQIRACTPNVLVSLGPRVTLALHPKIESGPHEDEG